MQAFEEDVQSYDFDRLRLQDSLQIFKRLAIKLQIKYSTNSIKYNQEIDAMKHLIQKYPDMDSYYLTATVQARKIRFAQREYSNQRITATDNLLVNNTDKFEEIEGYYRKIVTERFPNTRIIDTTNLSEEEVKDIFIKNDIENN
jgi:hypothetical protein